MNECYYTQCAFHPKDEPFCPEVPCKASEDQLQLYKLLRDYRLTLDFILKEMATMSNEELIIIKNTIINIKKKNKVNLTNQRPPQ